MAWTIESALDDKSIDRTEKTLRGYSLWLKGIPIEIQVVLYVNPAKGGFNYHLSHLIKTPEQAGTYFPSRPWGDDEAYALHSAVSAITEYYSIAVEHDHVPGPEWLIKNPSGI